MDKHKSITIRLGDKKVLGQEEDSEENQLPEIYQEQAAALEASINTDSSLEEDELETRDKIEYRIPPKKRKLSPLFKVFLFAAGSALLIGVTLGFIMLRLFAGIDSADKTADNSLSGTATASDLASDASNQEFMIPALSAFVIQGGVFSTLEKAEEYQQLFASSDFPSIVWKRDGQFYLFAGAAATEQAAKEEASALTAAGIDVYVKKWETDESAMTADNNEEQWLRDFAELWNESVVSQSTVTGSQWIAWAESNPDSNKEKFVQLEEEALNLAETMEGSSTSSIQYSLLKMWKQMESLKAE
ncbi:SPOR domain-containing protein [Sediminibacillus massiliensis]|uniref:SPOR domain-containing protein n=1 Tax=Sediminibacillus massiliensis TaxID=1926277 RepID=UPI000988890A|nr:SPOR domain-containing protein [Sediminibacillus massiliensis]